MRTYTSIFFAVIFFVFNITIALAQEKQETLFSKVNKISGMGGPLVNYTSLNGQFAILNGGGGGLILNKKYFLGGYGMHTTATNVERVDDFGITQKLDVSYGGLWLGYWHSPHKLVHFTADLGMGWGQAFWRNNNNLSSPNSGKLLYAIEPSVGVELNIASFMKTGIQGGYRVVTGKMPEDISSMGLSAPYIRWSLLFGWFR